MHQISVENEFLEGPNNLYLFDEEKTVLVDAGYDTEKIRSQVTSSFSDIGLSVPDLDEIYITHYHIDHCGLLEWLVEKSGATVYAHPADIPLIEGSEEAWGKVIKKRYQLVDDWGVPTGKTEQLRKALLEDHEMYGNVTVEPIRHGTEVDIGTVTLRAIHTPGHALGHLSYEIAEENMLLSGDALLPIYTPNVGGADIRVENPLTKYITTLEKIAAKQYDTAWPGHRNRIEAPTERAEEIIQHHEERALRVLQILKELEEATIWKLSTELFGELNGVHILHGPGETYAHVDHLQRTKTIEKTGTRYSLTPETMEIIDGNTPNKWSLTK